MKTVVWRWLGTLSHYRMIKVVLNTRIIACLPRYIKCEHIPWYKLWTMSPMRKKNATMRQIRNVMIAGGKSTHNKSYDIWYWKLWSVHNCNYKSPMDTNSHNSYLLSYHGLVLISIWLSSMTCVTKPLQWRHRIGNTIACSIIYFRLTTKGN